MIGRLPTSLEVNSKTYDIRSDYRDCLLILQAFSDEELTDVEKQTTMLECLYIDWEDIPQEDVAEAIEKAIWFLNCGDVTNNSKNHNQRPIYDWEQDEQMIFSSINKVAGTEVRALDYMHFWTFIGLFNEIGEGMFSSVVSIRQKKNKHKKLEKHEQEFYRENKNIIDLKRKYTESEQKDLMALDEILGQ